MGRREPLPSQSAWTDTEQHRIIVPTAHKKSGLLRKAEHKELTQCEATGKASQKKRRFICCPRLKGREIDKEEKETEEERPFRRLPPGLETW